MAHIKTMKELEHPASENSDFISVRGQSHSGSVSKESENYQYVSSKDVSSVMRRWDIETPLTDPLCESQCESSPITDMCSICAAKGIGIIATHICRDCSQYGRYYCQSCWDYHHKFLPTHDTLSLSVSSERTKDSGFKLKALQQSNDELKSENEKLKKKIKEIKQKNIKMSEELRDCKIHLDRGVTELKIKTNECKRVSKRWNENRRLIVKDRYRSNRFRFVEWTYKTPEILIVATIDFDTTDTRLAFGFTYELNETPLNLHIKNPWKDDTTGSSKTSTSVLIRPDGKTFDSFGYEAENKYADLVYDNEHTKWFFFNRFNIFNMNFENKLGIVCKIMLEDVTGKQLEAKTVYALSIKYLKDELMMLVKQLVCDCGGDEDSIAWAFTVPAFSNDAAKQFMIDAILEAGIQEKLVAIVTEPVAVYLLCRNLPDGKPLGLYKESFASLHAEGKYMIVDVRGWTIQITVLELLSDGYLRELYAECDVGIGGTNVDQAYEAFLSEILGAHVIKKFKTEYLTDYRDMFRDFEIKKKEISPTETKKVRLLIPLYLFENPNTGKTFKECISLSRYKNQIYQIRNKMVIEDHIIKSFFDKPLRGICDNMKAVLEEPQVSGCSTILMVGEFSEHQMLQEHIKVHFPDKNIIIPEGAGLFVINGAINFGHTMFNRNVKK